MSELNIHQRINAVMKEVSFIQKNAEISTGNNTYNAVTRDAVVGHIRQSIIEHGITPKVSQISGEFIIKKDMSAKPPVKQSLYSGRYQIMLTNIDNPKDFVSCTFTAHALDGGDKSPGKAATYAEKVALLKFFMLETGENEEGIQDFLEHKEVEENFKHGVLIKKAQNLAEDTEQDIQKGCEFISGGKFSNLADLNEAQLKKLILSYESKKAKL